MAIQTIPGSAITAGTITATQMSNTIQMGGPKISSIILTDSGYATITDTVLGLSGGYIRILGTGFVTGCSVSINTVIATSVTFISSTEVRAQLPSMSAGTYIMYLSNSDGGVAIRVNALTYSSTPTWSSTSPLPGGVNNTAISIQLGATSDSTVSYTVQAGSTLPIESQISPKAFSITIVVADQYFKSTVLLLNGDVTPFTADASTNKFEISAVGSPSANINNPLQPIGYYSAYFNGTSGLNVPDSAGLRIMSGDTNTFIAEGWFYFLGPLANAVLFDKSGRGGISFTDWTVYINASSQIQLHWSQSGSPGPASVGVVASTVVPTLNMWYHIAFVKSSADWAVFANGTRIITYSGLNSANDGNPGPLGIGQGFSGAVSGSTVVGYISNVRVYNSTAVGAPYSATSTTLTVPTAPLTAIPGTMLLTLQNNYFKDNSSINATIALLGQVSINVAQPFAALSAPYTGYGSGYFDGSSYINVPSNAAFGFGTGDFTVEGWFYPTSTSSVRYLFSIGSDANFSIALNSGTYTPYFYVGATIILSSISLVGNQWNHFALVRSGTTATMYINGLSGGTATFSTSVAAGIAYIGTQSTGSYNFPGYISNLRITKGTAVYTGAFTPPTLAALTNAGATSAAAYQSTTNVNITFASSATSLLTLQTNQAQNNNQFRDSSINNFAVTRTGTPTQGTFTPFSQTGWSAYFNGAMYMATPGAFNTAMVGLAGSLWTLELWIYVGVMNAGNGGGGGIIGTYDAVAANGRWIFYYSGTGPFTIALGSTIGTGSQVDSVTTATFPLATWTHIAMTIDATTPSNSTVVLYINGVGQTFTGRNMSTQGTNYGTVTIGGNLSVYSNPLNGYINNLRFIKGAIAYTGNFTPPTLAALTNAGATSAAAYQSTTNVNITFAASVTLLLTFQSNRFKDNSINNFNLGGGASIQAFSPFAPTTTYSATTVGGSVYFPGSSNLLVPSNASFALGTGDFTIEMWVYNTSTTNRLISYATATSPIIYINTSNYVQYDNYGVGGVLTSSILTPLNTWNHIAIVRLSATSKIYINGVQGASGSDTNNWGQAGIYIGVDVSTTFMTGYMSNLRIVKGTAVYTGAFTPPTAPLTAIAGTSLLLNATNSGIYDSTGKNDLTTVGDARTSTAVIKYGSSSMYFDGTGDYLDIPNNQIVNFASGDYTVEAWVYPTVISSDHYVFSFGVPGGHWSINIYQSNWRVGYNLSIAGGSASAALNTWTHVAVTRSSGTQRFYLNGALISSVADTNVITANGTVYAGAYFGSGNYWNGYIDDLRVTKGVARYTANFTPPTTAMLGK